MPPWIPNFSWVDADLAIGGSFPAENAAVLAADHGVGAVVDLRAERCDDAEALRLCGMRFLHLPTDDMAGVSQRFLDRGVAFAADARRDGLKVLIHCEHGIGRSATLALCVLADQGLAPMQALIAAKDARTLVSPSEAQYQAWALWLRRRGLGPAPSFPEFGMVAYRHLATA